MFTHQSKVHVHTDLWKPSGKQFCVLDHVNLGICRSTTSLVVVSFDCRSPCYSSRQIVGRHYRTVDTWSVCRSTLGRHLDRYVTLLLTVGTVSVELTVVVYRWTVDGIPRGREATDVGRHVGRYFSGRYIGWVSADMSTDSIDISNLNLVLSTELIK